MTKISDLETLPINFRHEKEFLKNNNFNTWESIYKLTDIQISYFLQKKSLCTESRFKKIRAISLFIIQLKLEVWRRLLKILVNLLFLEKLKKVF